MIVLQFYRDRRQDANMAAERAATAEERRQVALRMDQRDNVLAEMQQTTIQTCKDLVDATRQCERNQSNKE